MEAAAMDTLIEKGRVAPELARAIGEALDITLKAANVVTVPMLDVRFAQHEARMEARFGGAGSALQHAGTSVGKLQGRCTPTKPRPEWTPSWTHSARCL